MKNLIIFVEGSDDKRFFQSVIVPVIESNYDCIQFYEYASQSKKKIKNFLNSIKKMKFNYIFIKDYDRANCITQRKKQIAKKFNKCDESLIQIVKLEIESWYAAGITEYYYKKLKIKKFRDCNNVCKNTFETHLPPKAIGLELMIEILHNYDLNLGVKNNQSLKYFIRKMVNRIAA